MSLRLAALLPWPLMFVLLIHILQIPSTSTERVGGAFLLLACGALSLKMLERYDDSPDNR